MATYYDPNKIRTSQFQYDHVIYFDGKISIIFGYYKNNPQKSLGMRWISNNDLLGYPSVHGVPAWMVLPDKLALMILEGLWAREEEGEKDNIRDGFEEALAELQIRLGEWDE